MLQFVFTSSHKRRSNKHEYFYTQCVIILVIAYGNIMSNVKVIKNKYLKKSGKDSKNSLIVRVLIPQIISFFKRNSNFNYFYDNLYIEE